MRALLPLLLAAACAADPAPRPVPPTAPPTTAVPTSEAPDDERSFVTPSGNIACELTVEYAECSVAEHAWQPPGETCRGPALVSIWDGSVHVECGESGAEASSFLLAYGERVTVHRVTCVSERSGVTCRSLSGRGFTVSRARYSTS